MGAPQCGFIQGLHVDSPPRLAVVFANHHHPVLPIGGFVRGDYFKDTHGDISVQLALDFVMPMDRDCCRGVDSHGYSIRLECEVKWGA